MMGIYLNKSQHLWGIKISDIFVFIKKKEIIDKYFEDLLFVGAMQPTVINTKCQSQEMDNLFGWTGHR